MTNVSLIANVLLITNAFFSRLIIWIFHLFIFFSFAGELERKKRKVKDGHKDPVLAANSRLQEEIDQQIQLLRKHAEKNSILLAEAQRRRRLAAAAELAASASAETEDAADDRRHHRPQKV